MGDSKVLRSFLFLDSPEFFSFLHKSHMNILLIFTFHLTAHCAGCICYLLARPRCLGVFVFADEACTQILGHGCKLFSRGPRWSHRCLMADAQGLPALSLPFLFAVSFRVTLSWRSCLRTLSLVQLAGELRASRLFQGAPTRQTSLFS